MKKQYHRILILFILLPAVFLQGCWISSLPAYAPPATPTPLVLVEPPEIEDTTPSVPPTPGRFTLRYEPAISMNPLITRNRDNIVLSSLLYESLFYLDENLYPIPMLCVGWDTEDNTTFTFEIMPDVAMHDGSTLTAADVAYSINQARRSGRRHAGKLRTITSATATDDLTVTIVLESANARLIRLLDIPIIKSGSSESRLPPGTGPYIFPAEDAMRLTRFTEYRHYSDLPLTTIHLIECQDNEITEMFDDGRLSLLWDDPTDSFDIRINRHHEPRFFNTTAMQYIGFNANSFVLRNADVRRAIGLAIEHQYIVDNIMNVPRPNQTVASPVAISPVFDMYDTFWERRGNDPLVDMAALFERAGLYDINETSLLEMPDGYGGYSKFTLLFIVNIENSHKLATANYLADRLRSFGLDVTVRALPWSQFIADLEKGEFDIYYGETLLGADFNLTPLLMPGDQNLNFGRTAHTSYKPMIDDFLAAGTQEEVSEAGESLIREIIVNAPFVPILYKRHAIYSPMGVITGASPGQSGVFYNFHEWSIDLYMLN